MTTRFAVWFVVFGMLAAASAGAAQQIANAATQRGPRFLLASASGNVAVDVARTPILARRLSLDLDGVTRKQALTEIARQTGLNLVYGDDMLGLDARVQLRAESITVAAALTDVLWDVGLDVVFSTNRQAALVRRPKGAALPRTGEIVGRVTDAKSGEGVAKAEVFLERTRWQTTADPKGQYRLVDVDTGHYTLTVRQPGYAKQSRPVTVRDGQTDTVDVVLEPVAARLEELVTTATGRQRRRDIANDVTTINADSVMQTQPVRSVTDLLENRVPGLTVQRTSGAPGDPARLRLRGASSPLRSNDPIVVVDGIRFYGEQSANRSANLAARPVLSLGATPDKVVSTGVNVAPSPLDYIDPNIIETIEVLKGPSAATLYGQDAANGVIVITTKKGRPGPARWTMTAEHGRTEMVEAYPELLWRWGHSRYDHSLMNCPVTNFTIGVSNSDPIPCAGDSVVPFQLLNDPALTVLDQGNRTVLSLGVSGGNLGLTYSVTGSYANEVGLVKLPTYEADRYQALRGTAPPDWMRRPLRFKEWGVTSNVTAHLGTNTTVSLTTMLSRTEQQKSTLYEQLGELMSTYLDRSSGAYYRGNTRSDIVNIPNGGNVANPLEKYHRRVTADGTQFTNGVSLNWPARQWLTLTANAGINLMQRADEQYLPWGVTSDAFSNDTTGYVNNGQGRVVSSTVNMQALALAPLGREFQFRFSVGANYNGTSIKDVAGSTRGLAPGSSLQGTVLDYFRRVETSDATFGWHVEPSVSNGRFNFTSGLRLDGGSSYGADLKGFELPKFPKLGFSYLVSDEPFFPFKNLIQSFRMRVAYGRASRQPGAKDKLRLYGLPNQVYFGGGLQPGVALGSLGNTEVRPEQSSEIEGGFDVDLLDSRLIMNVTVYRKTTDDALLPVPVAPSVYGDGMTIMKNIGVTRNTGLEVMVGAQLVRSRLMTWTTNLQLSQMRYVVVSLAPGVEPFYTDPAPIGAGGTVAGGIRVAPGYPLFGRWSRPILGYADANGNGALDRQEFQLGDTAIYVGTTMPNHTATLSTTVSLWNGAVNVNAGFAIDGGLSQRNEVSRGVAIFSAGQQDPAASLAEQAARADLTQATVGGRTFATTDYNWIQTVSTTRFTNLAVQYNIPTVVARRLGAQRLSVAVQGSNLALWTNYRGVDPNVNAFGTGNNVTDTGTLPQPRTWQLQVQATY